MNKPISPVTPQMIAELKVSLKNMQAQLPEIEKAKRAGIDVSVSEAKLLDAIERAKKIIAVYGTP